MLLPVCARRAVATGRGRAGTPRPRRASAARPPTLRVDAARPPRHPVPGGFPSADLCHATARCPRSTAPFRHPPGGATGPSGAVGWRPPERTAEEESVSLPRLLDRAARPDPRAPGPRRAVRLRRSRASEILHAWATPAPRDLAGRRWGAVVVVPCRTARPAPGRRRAPPVGRPRAVVAWVGSTTTLVVPEVRPEWPDLVEVDVHATPEGGAVSRLRFHAAAPVHEVLGQLARDAGSRGASGAVAWWWAVTPGRTRRCRPTWSSASSRSGHESIRSPGARRCWWPSGSRVRSRSTKESSRRSASAGTGPATSWTCRPVGSPT